jgi:hypothetical protein
MKKKIKISRANFPGVGNFSWMNYFHMILSEKYDVIIDSDNPDLVFYSNLHYSENEIDYYTNTKNRGHHFYNENVKKIFISGEANPDYNLQLNLGSNYYCLGYENILHPRYLRFPTYVLDVFVLNNESGMFNHYFNWLTDVRNPDMILNDKKHFCSVVQSSDNPDRGKFFDLMISKYFVKSSGPWRPTIKPGDELPNKYQYHDYSNKEYMGKIDGLTYRDKINFFKDCYFNLSFQWTNTNYLTQEKIVHSFASNSIPIFYGNKFICDEGFNPNSFINAHSFDSFDDCFEYVDSIYNDKDKLKNYYKEPFFIDNKLPIYFDKNYLLEFFDKIINS